MDKFYSSLKELLEVDELDPDIALESYETWDSLTILSFIAMLDADFGVNMTSQDVSSFKTPADLCAFVQQKKTK